MIDSELVPWGKGEKHPGEGGEIVPETIYLQGVGALLLSGNRVTACLLKNEPTSLFYVAGISSFGEYAEWKRGLIARFSYLIGIRCFLFQYDNWFVAWTRPEAGWPNHGQVEVWRNSYGGPNPLAVQH